MSVDPRVAACYQIAKEACDLARLMPPTAIVEKPNGDLATLADIATQAFIIKEISKRFPDDTIKAEEGSPSPGTTGVVWHVDPLDGTLNFKRNMGPWAVSIGVLLGNDIIAGCIVEGTSGDIFTASQGAGAQRNGRPIYVAATAALNEALVGFDCPYDKGPRMQTTYPAIGKLLRESKALRCYGSCAIALCKIATGELDAYAVEYGKSWDFAAGTLLVREAGGTVTTWAGQQYSPEHNTQVLATNSILHADVRDLLTPFVAAHPTS